MKKILLLLAALTVIAACNPDIETSEAESNATVKVKAGKAGTKTAISQNGDTFSFTWTAGDKLAVIEAIPAIAQLIEDDPAGNYPYITELYDTEGLTEDAAEAVFTLNLDPERDYVNSGQLQYVAIYPWSGAIDVTDDWSIEKNRVIVTIDFPSSQHPTASSFDPKADVLVSKIVTCSERPSELSFQFARVGTIIKMVLTGLPEGATITGGELQLNMEAVYYMKYDPVDQKLIGQDGTDGISFYYGDTPLVVGADRSATIWLRCMSGVSDHIYLTLYGTVNGEETYWTRHVKLYLQGKTLEFKEGGLTTFSLKMGKPDVDNPDPDIIDYYTNDNLDGVTVFWPLPETPNFADYECFLLDANGGRHSFDTQGPDGSLFKATINSGLAPGIYSLSVRALAVEGKESQNDYEDKDGLYIGIPYTMTISNSSSNNSGSDASLLTLPGYNDADEEDFYHGVYFYARNLEWQSGNMRGKFFTNSKPWAFWNKNALRLTKLSIIPGSGGDTKYQIYASNSIFSGGMPSDLDTPLTGTVYSGTYYTGYTYQLNNASHFLIYGLQDLSISEIELEFYK